jgi:opacity protein-like surface antigen
MRAAMKLILCCALAVSLASPALALDFATHPFFKHLIGDWEAKGELKGENDNTVTVTETWTGKADAGDSFFIEGTRTINGDTQSFRWTITHNPATEGYEAILTSNGDGQPLRFEASLSDVDMVMRMKAITGGGDSSISLEDSFADEAKETLHTKVTFTGDQGQTTLEGTIVHTRKKAK